MCASLSLLYTIYKTLQNFAKVCTTFWTFCQLPTILPYVCVYFYFIFYFFFIYFFLFFANFQLLYLTYFFNYSCYNNSLWDNSNAEIEWTLLSVLSEPKYILGARLFSLNIPPSITIGAATLRVNTEWWVSGSPGRARPFLTARLAFCSVANIHIIIEYNISYMAYTICNMLYVLVL